MFKLPASKSIAALAALCFTAAASFAPAQTYVSAVSLLSTSAGWNQSSNGLWVLPASSTNATAAADVTQARDVTLYTSWDAMATNAANSNIVFQAYASTGGGINSSSGSGAYNSASNGVPAFVPPAPYPFSSVQNMGPTNGFWARDTALDFTNSVNGGNSVSNTVTFTGLGGIGFIYWTVAYTGGNTLTNFQFTYGRKVGLR